MADAAAREPRFYALLRGLGSAVLRVFYREVSVRCEAPPPETGPVIFAANHPNTLMDPLGVAQVTKRPLHFLAKSGLFKKRFAGWFLRGMGVIPVYRKQDDPAQMDKNEQAFEACYQALAAGQALALFPEGLSHDDLQLKPLKTGAARIALEAEQANGNRLGVKIVPIGLTFPNRARFRSTLSIRVGAPIDVAPYTERYASAPEETFRALTAEIEERLRQLMIHMDRLDLSENVRKVEEAFRDELRSTLDPSWQAAGDTVVLSKSIADAAERLSEKEPDAMAGFWMRVDRYWKRLQRVRLRDEALRDERGRLGFAAWLLLSLVYGVIALPLALYGLVNHWVPYEAAGRIANRLARGPEDVAPYKVYFGAPLFLLAYAVQGYLVWRWTSTLAAAMYVGTLPFVGLWALAFFRKMAAFWGRVRLGWLSFLRPATVARLREEREELRAELEGLKQRYLALREGEAASAEGNRGAGI